MKELLVIIILLSGSVITFWPPMRFFLDGYLARLDVAVSGGEQRGYLYWCFLFASLFISFFIVMSKLYLLNPDLVKLLLSYTVSFLCYILLTGYVAFIKYWFLSLLIAAFYMVGSGGIMLIYTTYRKPMSRHKKWLRMFIGVFCIAMSWIFLERLFWLTLRLHAPPLL